MHMQKRGWFELSGGLQHLKIETRGLRRSVMGECVLITILVLGDFVTAE